MEKKRAFLINIGYYGFFVVILFLAGKYLLPVLMPFVMAFIIAFVIRRPAGGLARAFSLPRKPFTLLLLILFYLLFAGVIFMGGGKAFSVIRNFVIGLPRMYQTDILPLLNDILDWVSGKLANADPFVSSQIEQSLQEFVQNIGQMVSTLSVNLLRAVSEYIAGIPSLLIRVVITIVTSFYICADYDRIMKTMWRYLPESGRRICVDIRKYGLNMIKVYIKSYSLLFLMTFAELALGFVLLGIPYPMGFAAAIAVFDILPVLGTGGVLLPWAAVLAIMGNYSLAAWILILYIVITVIRNSVEPRIVGKQIGLHPLLTLIALFTGVSLAGLPGLILFPMALMIFVNMEKNGAIQIRKKKGVETHDTVK